MTSEEQSIRSSVIIDGFTDDYDEQVTNDGNSNANRQYEQTMFLRTKHRHEEQIYNVRSTNKGKKKKNYKA